MNSDLQTWLACVLDDMDVYVVLVALGDPIPPAMVAFRSAECQDGRLVAAFDEKGLVRCEFVRFGDEPCDYYAMPDTAEGEQK